MLYSLLRACKLRCVVLNTFGGRSCAVVRAGRGGVEEDGEVEDVDVVLELGLRTVERKAEDGWGGWWVVG
jgi:hypothetical protein